MVVSETLSAAVLDTATGRDAAGALALSDAAGWNQTADDWALFSRHGRVLGRRSANGHLVATAAALPYGDAQGWISMVLVDPAWRHRGLATELLGECIAWLRAAGVTPVLDATPAGEPVYRRLGFQSGMHFERWQADLAAPRQTIASDGNKDAQHIAALDARASGVTRRFLLDDFLARPDTRALTRPDGQGFVLVRAGRRAAQIGPLVAADTGAAIELLEMATQALHGPVFLDAVTRDAALTSWLLAHGFSRQRPFVRMSLGPAAALHGSDSQFLVAGPEFG